MSCAFIKVRRAVVCSAMRAATAARRVGGWGRGLLRGGGVASVTVYAVGLAAVGWLSVVQLSYTVAHCLTIVNTLFEKKCNFLFALHMQHISAPPCVPFHHARPPLIRTGHTRRARCGRVGF